MLVSLAYPIAASFTSDEDHPLRHRCAPPARRAWAGPSEQMP